MGTKEQKIDFVILWVDGNDPEWKKQKDYYIQQCSGFTKQKNGEDRYREWDQLQYWFRGVEKFAPWVNKIHFVTWGHLPKWLNTAHPKLHVVRHEEIIPQQFLPVFSSHAIEICLHNIKGLSEQFVYFNDDIFLLSPIKETVFFQNGLPCCEGAMQEFPTYGSLGTFYSCVYIQNMFLLNRNFCCRDVMKKHWRKFINPIYGLQKVESTLLRFPWRRKSFAFFFPTHSANPFLKSVFSEVWEKESAVLLNTCSHRFRSYDDVNQYAFFWWQICKGQFTPARTDKTFSLTYLPGDLERIRRTILHPDKPILCMNDNVDGEKVFLETKAAVNQAFDTVFPEKSSFEL